MNHAELWHDAQQELYEQGFEEWARQFMERARVDGSVETEAEKEFRLSQEEE